MDINLLINFISGNSFGLNWIDIIIIVIVIVYGLEGYFLGFLSSFIDFISFILSFIFGLSFYYVIAKFLVNSFNMPQGFANAAGFLVLAIVLEIIISITLKRVVANIKIFAKPIEKNKALPIRNLLGTIPGVLSGLVLSTFILSLIVALPFSVFLKHSVTGSKIGSVLIANTQSFSKNLNKVFGGAVNDTLSFLTVEPKTNERVNLNFTTNILSVDKAAEQSMFTLVNNERTTRGLKALIFSESLAQVGRDHCKDMFKRGYFSHHTPEGLSPFDRMEQANITFTYGGENLALAPNSSLAMKGLMESEGHRENILSKNFGKVGVGVIDGGVYGQMFCQEFTD